MQIMAKLKFKNDIFKSSNKSVFKYYQENKKRLQKKLVKDIKIFLMKKKNNNMVGNVTKILQKKSKSWLSIEKIL